MFQSVDDDEIAAAFAAPAPKTRSGTGAVTRKRKPKHIVRDYDTWFYGLEQTLDHCENTNCVAPPGRPRMSGKEMTAVVDGNRMCRYCFLDGYGVKEANGEVA